MIRANPVIPRGSSQNRLLTRRPLCAQHGRVKTPPSICRAVFVSHSRSGLAILSAVVAAGLELNHAELSERDSFLVLWGRQKEVGVFFDQEEWSVEPTTVCSGLDCTLGCPWSR